MSDPRLIVDHRSLTDAASRINRHYGLPPDDARLVADGLVLGDLRGA